jgi:hypothetical protein
MVAEAEDQELQLLLVATQPVVEDTAQERLGVPRAVLATAWRHRSQTLICFN